MKQHQRKSELRKEVARMHDSRDQWKDKNKERYEENKALRSRIIESRQSRDQWKSRSKELEKQLELKEKIISVLTSQLEEQGINTAELEGEIKELKKNYLS
jgi:hypothetical protein